MKTTRIVCPSCEQPIEVNQKEPFNWLAVIALLVGVLVTQSVNTFSTNPRPQPQSAHPAIVVSNAPEPATEVAPLQTNGNPIIGTLGFVLGEKLPPNFPVTNDDESGLGTYQPESETRPSPPISLYYVHVLSDRRIYEIYVYLDAVDEIERINIHRDMLRALSAKYGEAHWCDTNQLGPGESKVEWTDGTNKVSLKCDDNYRMQVQYESIALGKMAKQIYFDYEDRMRNQRVNVLTNRF